MSVNVLPPLFRYTNGPCDFNNQCVGTIRSTKPSLLMSPQIGLPHECFAFNTKPTSLVTSRNCWATATDERTVTNPAAVARHENAFKDSAVRHPSNSEMRRKPRRKGDRFIKFVV